MASAAGLSPKKFDIKKVPKDIWMHIFVSIIALAGLMLMAKAMGLKFLGVLLFPIGVLSSWWVLKEIWDTGVLDSVLPVGWLSWLCIAIIPGCGGIVAIWAFATGRLSGEGLFLVGGALFPVLLLLIFGPKGRATGFSTDDLIADLLGMLITLGITAIGYYFVRLVRYETSPEARALRAVKG